MTLLPSTGAIVSVGPVSATVTVWLALAWVPLASLTCADTVAGPLARAVTSLAGVAAGHPPAPRPAEGPAGRSLSIIDDVGALDRRHRQRRPGLGHRHGLARTGLVAVGIAHLRRHRRGAVGKGGRLAGGGRRRRTGAGRGRGGNLGLVSFIVG